MLFGPPGTGKTTTLVSLIEKLKSLSAKKRILITAPSNTAADQFCDKLS